MLHGKQISVGGVKGLNSTNKDTEASSAPLNNGAYPPPFKTNTLKQRPTSSLQQSFYHVDRIAAPTRGSAFNFGLVSDVHALQLPFTF